MTLLRNLRLLCKKNEEVTFYQIASVAAMELTPRRNVVHVRKVNAYYQERNAL